MRGRRPKPNEIKRLSGNPGRRPLNAAEPQPGGRARCPSHLSKDAKREWRRIAPELDRLGLLTMIDQAALAAYCSCWALTVEAEKEIRELGAVIIDEKGRALRNPAVNILRDMFAQMRLYEIEFGMTPSARSRIHVPAASEAKNPFAEFTAEAKELSGDRGETSRPC
jgi:P27 family predicted phage terminase small subunit